jgi:hypothetical protein
MRGRAFAPIVAAAVLLGSPRAPRADAPVTWAAVPTPSIPDELLMEPRGVWTQAGTQYGYDGTVRLRLSTARPWSGIRVAWVGPSIAAAGGETRPKPRSDDSDATYELASTALFDGSGKSVWLRRWTRRPVEVQHHTLQLAPGPDGSFFVTGLYWGCTTFGAPGPGHCSTEDISDRQPQLCFEDTGCQEPFRLQYDGAGRLMEARTFPGTGGKPTLGPAGEIAIFGQFRHGIDVGEGKGALHVDAGRPGRPPDEDPDQGLILFYDARARWRWGRAMVSDRGASIEDVTFAADGSLWAYVQTSGSATDRQVVTMVGGKKAQVLIEEPGVCGALLEVDRKGSASVRERACEPSAEGEIYSTRLSSARKAGVFVIANHRGQPLLRAASLPTERLTTVADAGQPAATKGGAVLWYQGARAVWGLRGPPTARIRGAYDPGDDRVCVLFDIQDRQTWIAGGARVTLGEPKKPTTQIGCFPVSITER